MSIKIRYFASLKEGLGREGDVLPVTAPLTAEAVWQAANPGRALPSNVLVAVNMQYAGLEVMVKAGDEVAFFPPVTGG